jgi:hypothetical protein
LICALVELMQGGEEVGAPSPCTHARVGPEGRTLTSLMGAMRVRREGRRPGAFSAGLDAASAVPEAVGRASPRAGASTSDWLAATEDCLRHAGAIAGLPAHTRRPNPPSCAPPGGPCTAPALLKARQAMHARGLSPPRIPGASGGGSKRKRAAVSIRELLKAQAEAWSAGCGPRPLCGDGGDPEHPR